MLRNLPPRCSTASPRSAATPRVSEEPEQIYVNRNHLSIGNVFCCGLQQQSFRAFPVKLAPISETKKLTKMLAYRFDCQQLLALLFHSHTLLARRLNTTDKHTKTKGLTTLAIVSAGNRKVIKDLLQ